jgi:phenylacetate-CoA ligase
MDPYGRFFARVLHPAWETGLRRRPTLRHLRYLEETQWRSLDELTAIQSGELRRLLRHAYANVPHYRALFEQAHVSPDDIRDADDLRRLPILERDRARDTVDARTATAGAVVEIRKSTSGTMGRPLVFGYERTSEYWRQACKLRGYGWAGYHPGLRSLHYWGGGPPPVAGPPPSFAGRLQKVKVQADRALRREHYVDCGRRGSVELDAVVEIIKRERPEVLVCYSQAGADLARHVLSRGARTWDTIPVVCGAERLLPADRVVLEQAFGDAVFETYGCREVMLISTECDAHDGQHVSMETLVVEIVVREPGGERPAQPGELGEVVVTDLTNLAMPFIRYANGDLAVAGKPGTCTCGRALPRLASVEGRVTETLLDASGARVNGLVFNVVIAHLAHAIRQFQVVQHKDRSVTLRVAPTATFDAGIEAVLRATWERYLAGVPVTLELVTDLPISASGKRQVVVVERD